MTFKIAQKTQQEAKWLVPAPGDVATEDLMTAVNAAGFGGVRR